MTSHRRARVQVWLARFLAVAFVLGGAVTAATSPAISVSSASASPLVPGARSVPFTGPGSAVGADELVAFGGASASSGSQHLDAATTAHLAVPRPVLRTDSPGLLQGKEKGKYAGATPARAPPLV